VDRDVKRMLTCRNWRRSAEDRHTWRWKTEEAKAQAELQCHKRRRRRRRRRRRGKNKKNMKNNKKDTVQLHQYSSVYLTFQTLLQFLMFL
jgi:hypothetical protein